jgi:membrane protease YdiL (CAAX protease family)
MSVQPVPASRPVDFGRWPRRLALSITFFLGACLVFLPYSLHALVARDARPFLWGGIALILLTAALLARRSQRLQPYWRVIYALFVASAASFADWFLSDWLLRLLNVPVDSPAGYGLAKFESMLVLSLCLIVLVRLSGDDLSSLYLQRGKVRWWLPIGLAAFAFFAITVIPAAVGLFEGRDVTWSRILPWIPWILLFVLSNGFLEELQFRGLLLPRFAPHIGVVPAILVTSVVFSLAHIGVNYTLAILPFLAITFVLGLSFATLIHKTDSLWGAVLFHALADIPVIVGIISVL